MRYASRLGSLGGSPAVTMQALKSLIFLNIHFAPCSAHAILRFGMMILTAAKRITTATSSMSITSTTTTSTITASGEWNS